MLGLCHAVDVVVQGVHATSVEALALELANQPRLGVAS